MTINKSALLPTIQAKINNLSSSSSIDDILLLSLMARDISEDKMVYVNDVSEIYHLNLPNGYSVFDLNANKILVYKDNVWYDFFSSNIVNKFDSLWTWGRTPLGDGTISNRSSPGTTAGGGTNWSQVSNAGDASFTAAIKSDSTLWTWGFNTNGQLGDNTATTRYSPGTTAGGGTNWKQVDCGISSIIAIKTDGTLWTWGNNIYGQLGDGTSGTTSRSSPGTTAGGGTNWKYASIGKLGNTAAIKTDGTLWTWGDNSSGQLGIGNTTNRSSPGTTAGGGTNWSQVDAGQTRIAAIKTDGTLWTWGDNANGALGDNTTTSRSSPGTTAGGGTNWKQVSCSEFNNMAGVKTDGTLWTWGNGGFGKLGNNSATDRSSPGTTAGGGTNWVYVSCSDSSAAIKSDGTLWTWGPNGYGVLGDGSITTRLSPGTTIGNLGSWVTVSVGGGSQGRTAGIRYDLTKI